MLQDIGNHVYHNAYTPEPPSAHSFVLYYQNRSILILRQENELAFPRFQDLAPLHPEINQNWIYLFSIDDDRFYLVPDLKLSEQDSDNTSRFCMVGINQLRWASPRHLAFAGITGLQLSRWYEGHRFCGRCGSPMRQDAKERMLYCDHCHQMEYPKISPAVIVAIKDKNRLLLTKYAGRDYKRYALIAGFCEIGETLEETIHREVLEEVGLKVTNLKYYKSQPWSLTDTLLMGFYCDLAEPGEIRLQEDELAIAEWFEREDIPIEDPSRASLTHQMIFEFKEGRQ